MAKKLTGIRRSGLQKLVNAEPTKEEVREEVNTDSKLEEGLEKKDITKNFTISHLNNERLLNLYYHRKRDEPLLTLKNVLNDVLDSHFSSLSEEIPERPDSVKEFEKKKSSRISQTRKKK